MITLKCECCKFERQFTDLEEAYKEGWDAPPHFTGYISCNLCPAVCNPKVLNLPHHKRHAEWVRNGRPKEFDPSTCGIDDDPLLGTGGQN